jgi:hypothetical protein
MEGEINRVVSNYNGHVKIAVHPTLNTLRYMNCQNFCYYSFTQNRLQRFNLASAAFMKDQPTQQNLGDG